MDLFNSYRQSIDINFTINEKPGHLCYKENEIQLSFLLAMTLYFYWGGYLILDNKEAIIRISYDEKIDIYINKKSIETDLYNSKVLCFKS